MTYPITSASARQTTVTTPDAPHLPTGVLSLDAARGRRAERNMVRRTLGGGA